MSILGLDIMAVEHIVRKVEGNSAPLMNLNIPSFADTDLLPRHRGKHLGVLVPGKTMSSHFGFSRGTIQINALNS